MCLLLFLFFILFASCDDDGDREKRKDPLSRRMSEKGIWEIWPVTSPLESGAKSLGRGKRNWNKMGLTVQCSPYLYRQISIAFVVHLYTIGIEFE